MPDHVHMIVTLGHVLRLDAVVTAWKRYVATQHEITWQQGFFEHRLRRNESTNEKAEYIRQNPIRAELASEVGEWPFLLEAGEI